MTSKRSEVRVPSISLLKKSVSDAFFESKINGREPAESIEARVAHIIERSEMRSTLRSESPQAHFNKKALLAFFTFDKKAACQRKKKI